MFKKIVLLVAALMALFVGEAAIAAVDHTDLLPKNIEFYAQDVFKKQCLECHAANYHSFDQTKPFTYAGKTYFVKDDSMVAMSDKKLISSVAANSKDKKLILFDQSPDMDVYLIRNSLKPFVVSNSRQIKIKYVYNKAYGYKFKKTLSTSTTPAYSLVTYVFFCSTKGHQVYDANIYNNDNKIIRKIRISPVEDVTPGTVGESLHKLTCNYDLVNNKPGN